MTIIVTGGAGFIGSNFIFHMLRKYPDYRIICLDKLTYAGNLSTLAPVMDNPNFRFVKLDICDREGVYRLFEEEHPDMVVFALAVAGVLGGGLQNAIIALAAISWPKYARIARSQTLAQKETQWMKAVRLSGSGTGKIILKHILPNIIGPVLVTAMLDIGTMMMELAALSFLGLGAKPPIPEWGSMMSDTRSLMTTSPWITFSPGIAIFISVMIFNLLGDTIRDYADPKSRR